MLLAETLSLGPNEASFAAGGGLVVWLLTLLYNRYVKQPPKKPAALGQALELAVHAGTAKLGPLTPLFRAISAGDSAALAQEVSILNREAAAGKLAHIFEEFVHARIPELMRDTMDRRQLLAIISQCEGGVDVETLLVQAKAQQVQAPAAVKALAVVLLTLALSLGMASSSLAHGPEVFEPTPRVAVVDAPVYRTSPSTQYTYSEHHRHSGCGAGWRRRGVVGRVLSAPARWVRRLAFWRG